MPGIDLHTHSNRSDGTFEPAEIVRRAAERDLEVIALTDHDTTEGLEEAIAAGVELGVEVVPGVEFSAEYERTIIHVLCYWPDVANAELQAELQRLRDDRFRRGELMVEKLQALGFAICFERVRRSPAVATSFGRTSPRRWSRPASSTPRRRPSTSTSRTASRRTCAKHALDPVDAVRLILGAGGICVLAHPGMWGDQTSVPEDLIERMAAAGMQGLEVDHTDHDGAKRAHYRAVADRLRLIPTGGSDCHGDRYDPIRLGTSVCDRGSFATLRALAER